LVDGDHLLVVGEHHRSKHRRGNSLHSVHVATSKQDVVIKRGINNFNVDEDSFSPKFNKDILKEPFERGWSSMIRSQIDGRWYYLRGAKFLPYCFGHDACGCTFINDTSMNCDVPNFDWYLESYQSGDMGLPTIYIECDESSVSRVNYPQGRKK
jgi:hypothetical protein